MVWLLSPGGELLLLQTLVPLVHVVQQQQLHRRGEKHLPAAHHNMYQGVISAEKAKAVGQNIQNDSKVVRSDRISSV